VVAELTKRLVRRPEAGARFGRLDRVWRERIVPAVIRRDMGICHACRAMGCQGTGANSADHDPVPRSECEARGIDVYDMSNLKAIHHGDCPFCGVNCNRVKFNGSMESFRLKWEARTGRKAAGQASSSEPEGREF
jgi:hypothetical protein